jgi:hypothetical protein
MGTIPQGAAFENVAPAAATQRVGNVVFDASRGNVGTVADAFQFKHYRLDITPIDDRIDAKGGTSHSRNDAIRYGHRAVDKFHFHVVQHSVDQLQLLYSRANHSLAIEPNSALIGGLAIPTKSRVAAVCRK